MDSFEIIRRSWAFYKLHFKRLWPLFLLGSFGAYIGINSLFPDTEELFERFSNLSTSLVLTSTITYGVILVFLFISGISLVKAISNTYKGHIIGVRDSYRVGEELFLTAVFVKIIYDLSVGGAIILLIFPAIILGNYLVFCLCEMVDQNKNGMDALLSSWAIVSGRWWEVFWKLFVTGLVLVIPFFFVFALITISSFTLFAVTGSGVLAPIAMVSVLGLLFFLSFVFVIMPMSIISTFEIYYYFRNNRDNKRNHVTDKKRTLIIKVLIAVWALVFVLAFIAGFVDGFLNL